jgi:two-component system response regulator MtrA
MNSEISILIVDDEALLAQQLGTILEFEGFTVLTATDGREALTLLETTPVNLILSDVSMPGMNGYQLLTTVHQNPEWVRIPFIFLTARGMDSDIRFGKELGVDDYLIKPIEADDLLAAVRGKLLRSAQLNAQAVSEHTATNPRSTKVGLLEIDYERHQVTVDATSLMLSPREFRLLATLCERPEHPFSPEDLIEITHEFSADAYEAGNLIRPLIRSLRNKLEEPSKGRLQVENVRGVGYRLVSA